MSNARVIFENVGEIDPRLISTFGVNVKESDSAIGFFGTGLKYALSILARHGCDVSIQSGEREFRFGKQTIEIRGKPFEFITMDSEPMGFTTEVGKQWELWMAYRELYCNAQDENGRVYESASSPSPQPGLTRVIVGGDNFLAVARDHPRYFLCSQPFLTMPNCDLHNGASKGVFYRRVLVGSLGQKPTRYTYNLTGGVELTEDRTLRHSYLVAWRIAEAIISCHDREVIRDCVACPDIYHESGMDFDVGGEPSAAFMEVVGQMIRDNVALLNQTAKEKWEKHAKTGMEPEAVELNNIERAMLTRALAFCARLGFKVEYPIKVCECLGGDTLGMASKETIYLSRRAFMTGTKCVAGTIIEEFVHLKHGHPDCSRPMQNYLLDLMVSMGEQIIGDPL